MFVIYCQPVMFTDCQFLANRLKVKPAFHLWNKVGFEPNLAEYLPNLPKNQIE